MYSQRVKEGEIKILKARVCRDDGGERGEERGDRGRGEGGKRRRERGQNSDQ